MKRSAYNPGIPYPSRPPLIPAHGPLEPAEPTQPAEPNENLEPIGYRVNQFLKDLRR